MKKYFYHFTLFGFIIIANSLFARNVTAVRNPIAPAIDGFIAAGQWITTDSTSDFIQMEPFKGQPATERTVVYINYDENNLYVAYKCYMKDPGQLVSNVRTRDFLSKNDDVILLMLDYV